MLKMKTFNELIQERLIANGIPSNTANGAEMLEQVAKWRELYKGYMFGIDLTTKEALFFEQSNVAYSSITSQFKGHNTKPPLAYAVADSVALDFYNKPIGSNGATYIKDAPNAVAESAVGTIARMNEIAENSSSVINYLRNIICTGSVCLFGIVSVAGDIITFSQSQLLAVGDTVTINNIDFTVLAENSTGLSYQLNAEPASGGTASYSYEFSSVRWPLMTPQQYRQFPNYS